VLFRIGTAARLADLEIATLRNWEQRYRLVVPARGPGGQRLYSREQIEQLSWLKDRIGGGLSAGEAHNLLRERLATGPRLRPGEIEGVRLRAEAQRARAEAAATRGRVAEQHARAVRQVNELAELVDAAAPHVRRSAAMW
jgi:DNA-binding transcriptional MerR regulator